eukprot:371928-Rhodomonas_salina.3
MSHTSLPTLAMSWLSLTQANTNFEVAEPPVSLGSKLRRYPNATEENCNRPPIHVEEISRIAALTSGTDLMRRTDEMFATLPKDKTQNNTLRRRHAGVVPQGGWGDQAWNDMGNVLSMRQPELPCESESREQMDFKLSPARNAA